MTQTKHKASADEVASNTVHAAVKVSRALQSYKV